MTAKDYKGGCHCTAVRFETTADVDHTVTCNCSICASKGLVLTFVSPAQFTLLSGADQLTEYKFNKHVIEHHFCKVCGVQPFAKSRNEKGEEGIAVNVRCLDDLDVSALSPMPYDGRAA